MKTFRGVAMAIVLGAAAIGLGACSDVVGPVSQAGAALNVTISNARVVMAPVSGNPAAVYFDLSYSGPAGVTLDAVDVEGAGMTMIHDYAESAGKMQMVMIDAVPLAQGTPVSFAPGGLHVMAMDPSGALKAGGTTKVKLTLSDGSGISVDVPVRSAGEDR